MLNKMKILFFSLLLQKHSLSSIVKPDFQSIGIDSAEKYLSNHVSSFFSLADFRKGFNKYFIEFAKQTASQHLHCAKKIIYDEDICKVPLILIETLLSDTQSLLLNTQSPQQL